MKLEAVSTAGSTRSAYWNGGRHPVTLLSVSSSRVFRPLKAKNGIVGQTGSIFQVIFQQFGRFKRIFQHGFHGSGGRSSKAAPSCPLCRSKINVLGSLAQMEPESATEPVNP